MISLWKRTLEPTDLRCELRDGDLVMGHFDNRKEALDWLWGQVAGAEDFINEKMCEVDYLQENIQEMRDFLIGADTQPKWFANPNPPEDASGLEGKLPKALLERPDRRLKKGQ